MNQPSYSKTLNQLSFEDTKIAFSSKSDFKLSKSYWIFAAMNQIWIVKLGTFFIKLLLFLHFPIKKLIKSTLFEQFCGGESIEECKKIIAELQAGKIGTILDYSVEGEESEKSFQKTLVGDSGIPSHRTHHRPRTLAQFVESPDRLD